MVKSGTERSDKYSAKFDAEVVRSRYSAVASKAKEKQVEAQQQLADIAQFVRTTLNAKGIPALQTIIYSSFGNKMLGIVRRLGQGEYGTTPHAEAMKAYNQWKDEGANAEALAEIFQYVIGYPPSPL